jgi:hypothetical protein
MSDGETKTVDNSTVDYIETIKNLKESTVDKSEYEKLRADNKKLLDSLVNGSKANEKPAKPALRESNDIRKELFVSDDTMSNLDFATKAIELRDTLLAKGEMDPFLPYGKQILPTDDDIASADRVAKVLKECIKYADGDNSVFTNELQRRTIDVRGRR